VKKLVFILLCISNLNAHSINSIAEVRKAYSDVVTLLPKLQKETKGIEGISSEGADAEVYKDHSGSVIFVKLTAFGEMGKNNNRCYFFKGKMQKWLLNKKNIPLTNKKFIEKNRDIYRFVKEIKSTIK